MTDKEKQDWCIAALGDALQPHEVNAEWVNVDHMAYAITFKSGATPNRSGHFWLHGPFIRPDFKVEISKLRDGLEAEGIPLDEWASPYVEEEMDRPISPPTPSDNTE